MTISRRTLIRLVGRAGGVAAAYRTMTALGLLPVPAAYAGAPALPPGAGTKVLILGGGIAGMVTAWELAQAGFAPMVLEARARAGGRNWSLRAGDEILEADSVQRVRWDTGEHLYFNPGPARIPHHHEGILSYCRMLNVKLEVMCNDNRAALMQDDAAFGGAPQLNRSVVNDSRGYVAELAAKALDQAGLGEAVTTEDKERLRAFLRAFGALDKDLAYIGSSRAGYATPPGAGLQEGAINQPLDLRQLLASEFWRGPMQFGEFFDQAPTMLQPVNGMGQIGAAFGRKLFDFIRPSLEVTQIRRTAESVRIIARDARSGAEQKFEAPIAVCTIPFSVRRGIDADFAAETRAAIAALPYVPAGKTAFLAERRFWELDHAIYGGISWTSRDSTQIWYPTAGINQKKGVYVGAYIWSEQEGNAFADKFLGKRLTDTLADTERVHPGAGRDLGAGVSVARRNIPYTRGAWGDWTRESRATDYKRLRKGDGPFLFAGEHMSHIPGWQEGAVRSAHFALTQIAERVQATR